MTRRPEITTRRSSCSAAASPGSPPPASSCATGSTSCSTRRAPSVGGMADSHHDAEGFTFDTGAHFITNRLATATGVTEQCRDVRALRRDGLARRRRSYDYPLGLLRVPRFLRAALAERRAAPVRRRRRRRPTASGAEYGAALADEIALPLVEAWSGRAGHRARAGGRRQDPRRHRRDRRAQARRPAHPPRRRRRLLPRGAAERQRLARVPRARDLDGLRAPRGRRRRLGPAREPGRAHHA